MCAPRASELRLTLLERLTRPGPLELDLSQVTRLDTTGVQLLLQTQSAARAKETPLHLLAISDCVREVLKMLELEEQFRQALQPAAPAAPAAAPQREGAP